MTRCTVTLTIVAAFAFWAAGLSPLASAQHSENPAGVTPSDFAQASSDQDGSISRQGPIEELRELLAADIRSGELSDEVRGRIEDLEKQGLPVLEMLIDMYHNSPVRSVTAVVNKQTVIRALEVLGGDGAKEHLLGVALVEDRSSSSVPATAAQAYAALADGVDELARLLESELLSPRRIGIRAMQGQPLTAEIIRRIGQEMESDIYAVHIEVAKTFAADERDANAKLKVELIADAIGRVDQLDHAGGAAFGSRWNTDEEVLRSYVQALAEMNGADGALAALHDRGGQAATAAQVASGLRGDADVRGRLREIAVENDEVIFRVLAVRGLREIANPDDVALLRSIAESDEAGRVMGGAVLWFPVREAATDVLRLLEQENDSRPE